MSTLTLYLQSAACVEHVEGVGSFVGIDASGSFGILPGRARFLTVLEYGLARYARIDGPRQYLACPGGVLYLADDELLVNTRRYLRDDDFGRISALLAGQLAQEEAQLRALKDNLLRLEYELLRRLRKLERWDA